MYRVLKMACKLIREEFCQVLKPVWNESGALRITSIASLMNSGLMPQWFDIYVGKEKNSQLAAAIPTEFYPGPKHTSALYVHESVEFEKFAEFFKDLPLNLSIVQGIYPLGLHQKNMLERYLTENDLGIYEYTSHCNTFQCPIEIPHQIPQEDENLKDLKDLQNLQAGFHFEDLKPEDAEFAAKNWKYKSETTENLFRESYRAGLPSTCIKNDQGKIVAHCMVADHHVGNLWVDPAFRRLGLAKFLVNEEAKKLRPFLDKIVAYVEIENQASLNLFRNKLKWIDVQFNTYWGEFYPK